MPGEEVQRVSLEDIQLCGKACKLAVKNLESFEAYHIQLLKKDQIVTFNRLLEKKGELTSQLANEPSTNDMFNGSHVPPSFAGGWIHKIVLSFQKRKESGEDKAFEVALAMYPEYEDDRWAKIAAHVPGKTIESIKHHYDLLVDDVRRIEAGIIPMPDYGSKVDEEGNELSKKPLRRKGTPWTREEHKAFLLGLETYGKGDWRNISR